MNSFENIYIRCNWCDKEQKCEIGSRCDEYTICVDCFGKYSQYEISKGSYHAIKDLFYTKHIK